VLTTGVGTTGHCERGVQNGVGGYADRRADSIIDPEIQRGDGHRSEQSCGGSAPKQIQELVCLACARAATANIYR